MVIIFSKVGIQKSINMKKSIYRELTSSINAFLLGWAYFKDVNYYDPFSTFGQFHKRRKEITHTHIGNKSLKLYLLVDSMVIYVDNPKKFMST